MSKVEGPQILQGELEGTSLKDTMQTDSIVRDFYKDSSRKWRRLSKDPFHRLEFDTTLRFLRKHLPLSGSI